MTIMTVIRMVMALCRALDIPMYQLARYYMDEKQCQADFNELVSIINADKIN